MRRSIITFEERPNTRERNLQRASVHSCLGGGNPSDIYLWWILWISIYDHGWKMADASRRGLRDGNAGRVSVDG